MIVLAVGPRRVADGRAAEGSWLAGQLDHMITTTLWTNTVVSLKEQQHTQEVISTHVSKGENTSTTDMAKEVLPLMALTGYCSIYTFHQEI